MQLQYKRRKSCGEQSVKWWNSMQLAWLQAGHAKASLRTRQSREDKLTAANAGTRNLVLSCAAATCSAGCAKHFVKEDGCPPL